MVSLALTYLYSTHSNTFHSLPDATRSSLAHDTTCLTPHRWDNINKMHTLTILIEKTNDTDLDSFRAIRLLRPFFLFDIHSVYRLRRAGVLQVLSSRSLVYTNDATYYLRSG